MEEFIAVVKRVENVSGKGTRMPNPTPPPATDPSPEALSIALRYFRNGMEHELARDIDAFRREEVEKERERCAGACNPLVYGMAGEEIRSRIVRGWKP